jgi:hypothetical protein
MTGCCQPKFEVGRGRQRRRLGKGAGKRSATECHLGLRQRLLLLYALESYNMEKQAIILDNCKGMKREDLKLIFGQGTEALKV